MPPGPTAASEFRRGLNPYNLMVGAVAALALGAATLVAMVSGSAPGRVAVTLMVFYVFALQCVSTVAVVRRETNSWKWPAFQWIYMGALAWVLAFVTYQGGRLLGFE